MNHISPLCLKCNSLLIKGRVSSETWEFYNCVKCEYEEAKLIGKWLPTEEDTNLLFYEIARRLSSEIEISLRTAIDYTEKFYQKFTNKEYCELLGVKPFDDDFFHHECFGLLFYISYFIIDEKDLDLEKFRLWRLEKY